MFFDFHCDLDFKILDSQSSLSQFKSGGGTLMVCALYRLESEFAGSGLIKLAAGLSPHAEKRFLQEIERGEWMPVMAQAMGGPIPAQQVQQKVRGLVFNNAVKFLQEHYV